MEISKKCHFKGESQKIPLRKRCPTLHGTLENLIFWRFTIPSYFFIPVNKKISVNLGQFKRSVPIGQMIEPKGKGGLISIKNYRYFLLDQKGELSLEVVFHVSI